MPETRSLFHTTLNHQYTCWTEAWAALHLPVPPWEAKLGFWEGIGFGSVLLLCTWNPETSAPDVLKCALPFSRGRWIRSQNYHSNKVLCD